MFLGCGTLSYRQEPLERALQGIRQAGFRGVELGCVCGYCEHIRPEELSPSDVERLADQLAALGVQVIGVAGHVGLRYPLLGKGPEAADRGFELLRRRADVARQLGAPIVNSGLGVAAEGEDLQPFYRRFGELLRY